MTSTKRRIGWGLLVALFLSLAPLAQAEAPLVYYGSGYGYMVDINRNCIMAWTNTTPPSTVTCQEGAPLWRSDTATWYYMHSGSWTIMAPTFGATTTGALAPTSITNSGASTTASDVGAVSGTNVSVVENGNNAIHKSVFTFAGLSLTMTDVGGTGSNGAQKIYTFPEGVIQVLGASCNLTTLAGSGGIADGAAVVESLGSVTNGATNATLTSTEADIVASYAGTLTAGAGVMTKYGSLIAAAYDGHTTATAVFLNVAVPDADSSAADTFVVTGTCQISWANLGDF